MTRKKLLSAFLLCALILPSVLRGSPGGEDGGPPTTAQHAIRSSVIGIAGTPGSAGGLRSNGTLGQPAIGISEAGNQTLSAGFWRSWLGWIVGAPGPVPPSFVTLLNANRPNPFGTETVVSYSLAEAGRVSVSVYDIGGRRVRTLVADHKHAGRHSLTWDGRNDAGLRVSSGIYFCRLQTQDHLSMNKMLILK